MTTFGEALLTARASLAKANVESAALDARLLLAAASGIDMAALIARGPDALPATAQGAFANHMRRRLAGEPVARILGEKEFWGLPFAVSAATLVPRPETETLVEVMLAEARQRFPREISICDLGTGSGAIIVALLTELPSARGVANDISGEALAVARLNAERFGVSSRVRFEAGTFETGPDESFDVVVTNPPYIKSEEIDALEPEVREHDPRLALDGGADGLAAYRLILGRIDSLLASGGLLGVEVGSDQGAAAAALCRSAGLGDVRVHLDLAGRDRVVTAVRTISEDASQT